MTSPPCRRSGSAPARRRARRPRTSAQPSVAVLLLAAALGIAGCRDDDSGSSGAALTQDRFDSEAAFELIEEQVAVGQRPAGSPQLRALAKRLEARLPKGRIEPVPGGLQNIVASISGTGPPALLIGAHYDTEYRPRGFVGANDGAAGTAAVFELARSLETELRGTRHREIRFVLFDGEEEGPGCPEARFAECGLRGSRAYAASHAGEVGELILLDYVANEGLRIPRELNSDPGLWERLRRAASRIGAASVFPPETQGGVIDDHVPFLEAGVPAIDLIDFSYPYADTLEDTPDKLSPESLDAVGETVAELALELAAPRPDQP